MEIKIWSDGFRSNLDEYFMKQIIVKNLEK